MHHRLLDEYTQRGFTIITVPVGTVEWRARYVLDHVEKIKKGK